jgi:hypothetical protein
VQVVNRPPVAVNDSVTTNRNSAVTILVLGNDSDPDGDPITVTGLAQPSSGTVILNSNGTVTFEPRRNATGTFTFTYKVTDGSAQSNTATVTVTVK